MKNTCESVFTEELAERERYPVHDGIYKLKEGRDRLERLLIAIETVGAFKRNEVSHHHLEQCDPSSIPQWLQRAHLHAAYLLGRTVLPAVVALRRNGVPEVKVSNLVQVAQSQIADIITRLDGNLDALRKRPIAEEYARMRTRQSILAEPIQDAIALIDWVLGQASIGQRINSTQDDHMVV